MAIVVPDTCISEFGKAGNDVMAIVVPLTCITELGNGGSEVILTEEFKPKSGRDVIAMVVPDTVNGTDARLLTVVEVAAEPPREVTVPVIESKLVILNIAPFEILTNPPNPNAGREVIAIVVPETCKTEFGNGGNDVILTLELAPKSGNDVIEVDPPKPIAGKDVILTLEFAPKSGRDVILTLELAPKSGKEVIRTEVPGDTLTTAPTAKGGKDFILRLPVQSVGKVTLNAVASEPPDTTTLAPATLSISTLVVPNAVVERDGKTGNGGKESIWTGKPEAVETSVNEPLAPYFNFTH